MRKWLVLFLAILLSGLIFLSCSGDEITTEPDFKVPAVPVLLSPENGSIDVSDIPILNWLTATGAESYSLQVSSNSLFSGTVFNRDDITGISQAVEGLSFSSTYYWRVCAANSYSKSNWSSVWNFTTGVNNNPWKTKASMPTPKYFVSAAVMNGKIYVIGGVNAIGSVNTVEEYDPVTNVWTSMPSMSTARNPSASSVGNKIYVIGGGVGVYLTLVEEYDPVTNIWVTKADMLTERSPYSAVTV